MSDEHARRNAATVKILALVQAQPLRGAGVTIHGTIRYAARSTQTPGVFTVVVRDEENWTRWVLWTRDVWLASLCERKNRTPRPEIAITFDAESKQLEGLALPVTEIPA